MARQLEMAASTGFGRVPRAARGAALHRRIGTIAGAMAVGLTYIFLLAPIIVVIFTSFNPTTASAFPPRGFSLRWYREFAASGSFTSAFQFSLWLGALAAVFATTIGFLTAYAARRFVVRRRELVQSLAMLPVMIPHILIGISLLVMLTVVELPELLTLLLGHVIVCVPFTVAGILASLEAVDPGVELAARTLGASRLRVMWEIVIPLIAPGLLSSLIFAFIISFGDVYIALFLSGPGMTTLPIEIFTYLQWESTPVVAAITSVQVLMIIALGLVIERLVGLRKIIRI
ncbi:MAG: ABC transporter permease [Proteobacteria bacterium]|nr:ABC transporter permease [Pseudomonadota bacterium]